MGSELPDCYVITDNKNDEIKVFADKARKCFDNGYQLIQLRKKECSQKRYNQYADTLIKLASKYNAKVILNNDPSLCYELNVDGVHLTTQRLMSLSERPLSEGKLVSAACHNMTQLKHAEKIGIDFVTLSPVLVTATHPEAKPLGWQLFKEWNQTVDFPVYALGGMNLAFLSKVKAMGAQGIAAIRSLWE